MFKILFSLSVVFSGLLTGYVVQKINLLPYNSSNNSFVRKILQKIVILIINPVAFTGSIWILNLRNFHLMLLPLAGIIAIVSGGLAAYLLSVKLKFSSKETGAFFCCGAFTNIGNIGALVCYSFLGEKGFALVPFYKLFEDLMYFSVGFPVAKTFSDNVLIMEQSRKMKILKDPIMLSVIISIAAGFLLNISGIKRPSIYETINTYIIPLSSFLMMSTIGMAIRFRKMKKYIYKGSFILPVKYLAVPAITYLFAFAAGLGKIDNGMPLKIVLILSSMPAAALAMIPPALYDLDLDLANTSWFISMIFMIISVPALRILISFI